MRRISYEKPLQRIPEHQAERKADAVRVEHTPHEVFHGLNITDDQALEYGRLGIRENLGRDLERWNDGRPAGTQILDERVTQKLKDICTREVSVQQQERNWVFRNIRKAVGFLRDVRALPLREHSDDAGQVFEDIYDRNEGVRGWLQRWVLRYDRYPITGEGPVTVDRIRANLARDIWNGLTPHDRTTMATLPTARVICHAATFPLHPPAVMNALANQQTTPEQLEQLRVEAIAAGVAGLGTANWAPLFPASERRPSPTLFDRLIQMKQVEGDEKKKTANKTVYDATRLQNFLDNRLRPQTEINNLVHEILVENSLYPLENNPDAQALVAYIEFRLNRDPTYNAGTTAVPDMRLQIRRDLETIRASLPSKEDKADDKEKSETQENLENIGKLSDSIQESYKNLKDQYAECPGIGQRIYDLRVQLQNTPAPTVTGTGTVNDGARQNITNQIDKAMEAQQKTLTAINKLENKYRDDATNLLATLNEIATIPTTLPFPNDQASLSRYNGLGVAALHNSDPTQLFGLVQPQAAPAGSPAPFLPYAIPGGSLFQTHIASTVAGGASVTQNQLSEMFKEIKNHYHKAIKKTKPEQLTCRQMLYMLKEGDLIRQRITNPELRRKYAFMATNLMITDVKNTALYESCNERLSERLGGSILDVRFVARIKKVISAYAGSRKQMLGEDVIAITTGINEKFSVFRNLKRDSTITELRELIASNGGIGEQNLFEFAEQLKEVLVGFNMLKKEGTVHLFDKHAVQLEQLVTLLQNVQQEMHADKFFGEIRGGSGNIGHAILKKIKEDEAESGKLEKELHDQMTSPDAEWKQLF
jgi:hypothetical protein